MNNMLNKQIKFHTKVGNGEKPLIVKLIKKQRENTYYCLFDILFWQYDYDVWDMVW